MSKATDRQQVSERAYGAAVVALRTAANSGVSVQQRTEHAHKAAQAAALRALTAMGWSSEAAQERAAQVAEIALLRAVRRIQEAKNLPHTSAMSENSAQEFFKRVDRAWEWPGAFTATWIILFAALGWPWLFLHGTARIVVGILWICLEAPIGWVWLANR
jgi:hypothetical protein